MKRILLVGNIIGSYRSQLIVNYLANRNYSYSFVTVPPKVLFVQNNTFGKKVVNFFTRIIIYPFLLMFFLLYCDVVIYLPMNSQSSWILKIARFLNKKTVYDFYLSQYLVSRENIKLGMKASEVYEKSFDINCLKYSTDIIFLNSSEKSFYQSLLSYYPTKSNIHIIPLKGPRRGFANLDAFQNNKKNFNICWWGKASQLHGIETMLLGLKSLENIRQDFEVNLFENNKTRAESLRKLIDAKGFQVNINVYDNLTFNNHLEDYLKQNCDIALGSFGDTLMARTVLLNKVIDSLSLSIPMVTQETKAIKEFGLEKDALWLTNDLTPRQISETINELMSTQLDIPSYRNSTLELHNKYFNITTFESALDSLFETETL